MRPDIVAGAVLPDYELTDRWRHQLLTEGSLSLQFRVCRFLASPSKK